MADITLEQAQHAYSRLADNWYHDEENIIVANTTLKTQRVFQRMN